MTTSNAPTLVISSDRESGVMMFDADFSQIRIGRARESEYRVSGRCVSRLHAVIARDGDAWYVVDASRHGTTVDGRRIERGQRVQLGQKSIVEVSDVCLDVELRGPAVDGRVDDVDPSHPEGADLVSPAVGPSVAAPACRAQAILVIRHGGRIGQRVPLATSGVRVCMGRDATCAVRMHDPLHAISKVHAFIDVNWAGMFVIDTSANGVFRNGARVNGCDSLRIGDRLTFASEDVTLTGWEIEIQSLHPA